MSEDKPEFAAGGTIGRVHWDKQPGEEIMPLEEPGGYEPAIRVAQPVAVDELTCQCDCRNRVAELEGQVTALREFAVLATQLLARPSIALRYISFPHYQRFCELAESVISDEVTLKRLGEANDFARNKKAPDGE